MCGRYYVADEDPSGELGAILAELERRTGKPVKRGEIFPTDIAPVIANNRAGKPTPFMMRWGFSQNGAVIINARSETAAIKPLFRDGMERRRCLVPASYYFEWEKAQKKRVKYAISAGRMAYMAGIYRMEETGPAFVILTREPAESIAFIHNRMPVILPKAAARDWLDGSQAPDGVLRSAVLDVEHQAVREADRP